MREVEASAVAVALKRKGYNVEVVATFDGWLVGWVVRTDAVPPADQMVENAEHAARLPNVGRAARRKGVTR